MTKIKKLPPRKEAPKEPPIQTRRVKMLMIKPEDFTWLFTKGLVFNKRTEIIKGLPADAKAITIAADSMRNGIMIVVESASYDPVPVNVMPPVEPININVGVQGATKPKKKPRKK